MEPLIFGTHDEDTVTQLKNCIAAEEGAVGVLCADGHKGYSMPIGGVVGYRNHVSPSGVGYDIACGNLAVQTNIHAIDVSPLEMMGIADQIQKRISFGVGRKNDEPIQDAPIFERIASSPVKYQRSLLSLAAQQLGTVGSGNHYVDVLQDEEGWLWVACHFGSRGFGHKTASYFMNLAQGLDPEGRPHEGEMMSPPLLLHVDNPIGQDYIEAMTIAGEYAYAGRTYVVSRVLEIFGAQSTWVVHNHHNFAWNEPHFGEKFWVVRKGATPAFPGQQGFIGGSMGDISVVVEGSDLVISKAREALYSTVHGAGRVMSRRKAAGKTKTIMRWRCQDYRKCDYTAPKGGYHKDENGPTPKCPNCGHKLRLEPMTQQLTPGLVDFSAVKQEIVAKGIILRGAGADEAPQVYRPLQSVLDAHGDTIRVLHTLTPRIVVMAGADEYDPYKD